jgi:hypothetical protein
MTFPILLILSLLSPVIPRGYQDIGSDIISGSLSIEAA